MLSAEYSEKMRASGYLMTGVSLHQRYMTTCNIRQRKTRCDTQVRATMMRETLPDDAAAAAQHIADSSANHLAADKAITSGGVEADHFIASRQLFQDKEEEEEKAKLQRRNARASSNFIYKRIFEWTKGKHRKQ
jgi:hypothetical protein